MRKSIALLLALLGLFDSLYLLWIYTSPSRPMVCFGTGCDAVRLSVYSHMAGVPMPVLGAAGYLLLALLIIAESLAGPALAVELRFGLAAATGIGFLFSLYLEYLQGFVIHAFCAWCVTSGVVMTALFALAVYNVMRPGLENEPHAQLAQVRSYFVVGVAALAIGIPAFYELSVHGEAPPPPPPAPTVNTMEKLVRPDSHTTGNPQAAVTVVEFGDFECPACGREAPVFRQLRDKYANQIRFVFRQFPLIKIHPFAERMAEASECAADQGKFWEAVDKIYARQSDLSEDGLKRDARDIGLDPARFNQCMAGGTMSARVRRDREDGDALGVNSTPTFFIGRHVITDVPSLDEFSRLIETELGTQSGGLAPPPQALGQSKTSPPPTPVSPKPVTPPDTSAGNTGSFGLLGAPPGGALSDFGAGTTCSEAEAAKKQPTLISTSQLRGLMAENSKPLFVDVRPAKEYASGKIPGAINIPVDVMSGQWSSLPRDRVIVFYESGKSAGDICAAGRAAGRILLEHGYTFNNIKVYQDGLAGWQRGGL